MNIISKNERKKVKEILTAMDIGVPIGKTTIQFAQQFMKENGGIERYEQELKNQISGPHGFVHVQHVGFKDNGIKVFWKLISVKKNKIVKYLNLDRTKPSNSQTNSKSFI